MFTPPHKAQLFGDSFDGWRSSTLGDASNLIGMLVASSLVSAFSFVFKFKVCFVDIQASAANLGVVR